jgi:alcohol dehydrogenase class IV
MTFLIQWSLYVGLSISRALSQLLVHHLDQSFCIFPSNMTESSNQPLFGLWQPRPLQALYYGPDCVQKHLLSCLPSESSKAFILTGSSLANKTSLVSDVEKLLGARHASTFSDIKQHAPVAELDRATELVLKDDKIDTIISIGGGSPIDSGKAISYRAHEKGGKWLHHITIPTTLSVAECKSAVCPFNSTD